MVNIKRLYGCRIRHLKLLCISLIVHLLLCNKPLFEYLFYHTPNYSFLHTFMCFYFPIFHPYNAHKLDFHFTICVFLGYYSSYLGYHCLNMLSQCIYIFYNVQFHKYFFYLTNIIGWIPFSCLHLYTMPL